MITTDRAKVLGGFINGLPILDGHNKKFLEGDRDREYLVVLKGKDRPLCLYLNNSRGCCLNGIHFISKDGKEYLYLSQCSEGGVMKGTINNDSVREYNDSVTFDSIKIVEWIDRPGLIHSTEEDA